MDTECIVCFDKFDADGRKVVTTDCGHFYHSDCINEWLKKAVHKTCPKCRRNITSNQLRNVFMENVSNAAKCHTDISSSGVGSNALFVHRENQFGRNERQYGQRKREIGRKQREIGQQQQEIGQQQRDFDRELIRHQQEMVRRQQEMVRHQQEMAQRQQELSRRQRLTASANAQFQFGDPYGNIIMGSGGIFITPVLPVRPLQPILPLPLIRPLPPVRPLPPSQPLPPQVFPYPEFSGVVNTNLPFFPFE